MGCSQIEGIAPWPLEGGAELIHGEHSIVSQLTKDAKNGVEIAQRTSNVINYVFWSDTEELMSLDEGVPEYDTMQQLSDEVCNTIPRLSRLKTVFITLSLFLPDA